MAICAISPGIEYLFYNGVQEINNRQMYLGQMHCEMKTTQADWTLKRDLCTRPILSATQ